ncbi:MAG: methyltransferase domain-containing protein [Wenzhouxiangellaceae bacterium]
MDAGFAGLQNTENRLVPEIVAAAGVDWLLECAPVTSPSCALDAPRHRLLLSRDEWVWPCRLPMDLLPFADQTLPAILLRHVFWQPQAPALLTEAVRCLKPGGLLVSVSANPWHRASWGELGRDALHLPAWPRLLMQHARFSLQLQIPVRQQWFGLIPGVSPLLLVVARKPPRPAQVRRLQLKRSMGTRTGMPVTSCRAA